MKAVNAKQWVQCVRNVVREQRKSGLRRQRSQPGVAQAMALRIPNDIHRDTPLRGTCARVIGKAEAGAPFACEAHRRRVACLR